MLKYYALLLSGHWKGNKKRSWWSHCQSKGETISWLFILLILIMVSTYFHLLQLPYHPMWFTISEFCVHFWFPGKSNARAIWFIYQCICKRLRCRGSDIFIFTHYFIYLSSIVYYQMLHEFRYKQINRYMKDSEVFYLNWGEYYSFHLEIIVI